ncbi:MAG: hypothetical protein JW945_02175 [Methanomicrobia archaeon]|nr:hypothetical protein [Methanomicrobia archaeon]
MVRTKSEFELHARITAPKNNGLRKRAAYKRSSGKEVAWINVPRHPLPLGAIMWIPAGSCGAGERR